MTYRIGSFNMKNFGANPHRDFEKIAEIIRSEKLDVVALQEILSEGKGVQKLLEQCVKFELYNWNFCWASPSESSDPGKLGDMIHSDKRGEGYAYIWNKSKFKLAEFKQLGNTRTFDPRIVNSLSNDVTADCSFMARAPYYIRLQPLYGGFFELRLINIHIYWGSSSLMDIEKRRIEYNFLTHEIYPSISQKRYGNFAPAYTVAMGDYNLNIYRPLVHMQSSNSYLNEIYNYSDGKSQYQVITMQDQLSTLKDPKESYPANSSEHQPRYANNYDHFTYSPELSHLSSVRCWAVDAVQKYCNNDFSYYRDNISDHLPVVMEINI